MTSSALLKPLRSIVLPLCAALAAATSAAAAPPEEHLAAASSQASVVAKGAFSDLGALVEYQFSCQSTQLNRQRLQGVLAKFEQQLRERFGADIVPEYRASLQQGAEDIRARWARSTAAVQADVCRQFAASEEAELKRMEERAAEKDPESTIP